MKHDVRVGIAKKYLLVQPVQRLTPWEYKSAQTDASRRVTKEKLGFRKMPILSTLVCNKTGHGHLNVIFYPFLSPRP